MMERGVKAWLAHVHDQMKGINQPKYIKRYTRALEGGTGHPARALVFIVRATAARGSAGRALQPH